MSRMIVQRSPTECGVSEYDREVSTVAGLGPIGMLRHDKKKVLNVMRQVISPLKIKTNLYITYSFRTQQTTPSVTLRKTHFPVR